MYYRFFFFFRTSLHFKLFLLDEAGSFESFKRKISELHTEKIPMGGEYCGITIFLRYLVNKGGPTIIKTHHEPVYSFLMSVCCHRIHQVGRNLRKFLFQPAAQSRVTYDIWTGNSGLHLVESWKHPEMETARPLWATCCIDYSPLLKCFVLLVVIKRAQIRVLEGLT